MPWVFVCACHQVVSSSRECTTSAGTTPGGEIANTDVGDSNPGSIRARFYSALYSKLLSPEYLDASNPVLFLNLLYKAMKADDDDARIVAFAKRLLQVGERFESVDEARETS